MDPAAYSERAMTLLDELVIMLPVESKTKYREKLEDLFRTAGLEAIKDNKVPARTEAVWDAYAGAYREKYGHEPLDGVQVRSMMKAFLKKVPHAEAPELVRFYVRHPDKFYCLNRHPFSFCLRDAQRLHSEWKGGRPGSVKSAHASSQLDRIRRGEL